MILFCSAMPAQRCSRNLASSVRPESTYSRKRSEAGL
uniref:Uncharacterized protein n=1 Tax=Anguilla anguilla TaxID=7936 RepID=A0A0E9RW87_ANGAN